MNSLKFNIELIGERGGNLCGADQFSIEACNHCQGHYLFNRELSDVYYDPDDLGRHFFKIVGMSLPPCRYCGDIQWDFSSVALDQGAAQAGPWGWALQSRQFTFSDHDSHTD